MTRYEGRAGLEDIDGVPVVDDIGIWLDDDPDAAPSYIAGTGYGEMWLDDGDLMGLLRPDARCKLLLDNGVAVRVRVNSFDRGGTRAQLVLLDRWPPGPPSDS